MPAEILDNDREFRISAETVLTIWFGPFTLVFAVYWSYILVRVFEAATLRGSTEQLAESYVILLSLMLFFFFAFAAYQRRLLEFGRNVHAWIRNLVVCLALVFGVSLNMFLLAWFLCRTADPRAEFLPALPTAVVLVLLFNVWALFGLGAMAWERLPIFRRVELNEALTFRDLNT